VSYTSYDSNEFQPSDQLYSLHAVGIIPNIIDPFVPQLRVHVSWPNTSADLGNTPNVSLLQTKPEVWLTNISSSASTPISLDTNDAGTANKKKSHKKHKRAKTTQLTLALTDPDAPSASDPQWSQMCHWIRTNLALNTTSSTSSTLSKALDAITTDEKKDKKKKGKHHKGKGKGRGKKHHKSTTPTDLVAYKPPGPPPRTGKHRYIFLALAPLNGTTERLYLSAPSDRQHWGYGQAGAGVREWMGEQGLGVVGANFVYAENEEQ